ncbi:hypothetical protein DVR12_07515 [Chitinophaga silvatica]|uniref:Type VI secretion system baseplate subunit TssF n=1 Tax=Chitinophaga silvatica TaxID=2282649 RepID=A0A3E1YER0_9BACT|nr:type VI secretion system baseplate subunit TssF [Chitinophaga silvatica]RFS25025.1 hypothetical protein DVR12_07515 [Chitinophaga silvatica]
MKEKIKESILKKAAKIWGYADSTIPTELDPIVTLLLEACAFELENISMVADESKSRMLENLATLLLPHSMVGPLPASSVLHAQPNNEVFIMPSEYQFSCNNSIQSVPKKSIWTTFTQHSLFPLQVKYIQTHNKIYQQRDGCYNELLQESNLNDLSNYNHISIGIKTDNFNLSLYGLSCYFEIRNSSDSSNFFQLLPFTKVLIGNSQLVSKHGLNPTSPPEKLAYSSNTNLVFTKHSYEYRTYKQLEKHFITIIDNRSIGDLNPRRNEDENIFWLDIIFPTGIEYSLIENLFFNINCFPVINKKLETHTIKTIPYLNIIPIETNDNFYAIKSVTNDEGQVFKPAIQTDPKLLDTYEFLLRTNGVSRFDQRSISDLIMWIIRIIQTECIVFQTAKNDHINNQLASLQQAITHLEELVPRNINNNSTTYLIFKPDYKAYPLNISFYSTQGLLDPIKTGTLAMELNNANLLTSSIRFVRNVTNGRNKQNEKEQMETFRYQFLTHDRIITTADIEALCRYKFSSCIDQVNVSKGTTILPGNNGYCRSINLDIYVKSGYLSIEQINYMKADLHFELKEKSSNQFPYVIRIIETNSY